MTRVLIIIIGLVAGWTATTGWGQDLTDGLLLYLPFEDGTTTPAFCLGRPEVDLGAGFPGAGRVGGGVSIIGNARVEVCARGNFSRPRGSMAFWHRPAWNPREPGPSHLILMQQVNFQLTWYQPRQVLFFMTGTSKPGEGYVWDYSVESRAPLEWAPDRWRHFALTWDAETGHKRVYLDGRLAAEGVTEWIRSSEVGVTDRLSLGSPTAPGHYDEWAVWDRVLSPAEVGLLAERPEQAAQALAAARGPEQEPPPPVIFELAQARPADTIVNPGQPFRLLTVARNTTDGPVQVALRLTTVDALGHEAAAGERELELAAPGELELAFEVSAERRGVHKLRAEYDRQGRSFRADLGSFAVWPEGRLTPDEASFFGHHVNSWYGGAFLRQAARLGLSWQRNHNMLQTTWWVHAEPHPGEFQWTHDFQLEAVEEAGMVTLGQFFTVPYWSTDPPGTRPEGHQGGYPITGVPRLDPLERYVRATVARYRDRIHVWEVWNEPDVSIFWKGSAEEFGRLSEAACRAAKETDPDCTVLVGGFTSAVSARWLNEAGEAGAFALADGISFHGYGTVEEGRKLLGMLREIAAAHGPQGRELVFWNSEWGVTDTTFLVDGHFDDLPPRRLLPPPSYLQGAARVVTSDAVAWHDGVKRSFYYLHNEVRGAGAYHNGSAIEVTRTPRPKLMARVALEALTRGLRPVHLVERDDVGRLMAVVFSGQERTLALVWLREEGRSLRCPAPPFAGLEALDLFGNPLPLPEEGVELSGVPVYLSVAAPAGPLAEHLRQAALD